MEYGKKKHNTDRNNEWKGYIKQDFIALETQVKGMRTQEIVSFMLPVRDKGMHRTLSYAGQTQINTWLHVIAVSLVFPITEYISVKTDYWATMGSTCL